MAKYSRLKLSSPRNIEVIDDLFYKNYRYERLKERAKTIVDNKTQYKLIAKNSKADPIEKQSNQPFLRVKRKYRQICFWNEGEPINNVINMYENYNYQSPAITWNNSRWYIRKFKSIPWSGVKSFLSLAMEDNMRYLVLLPCTLNELSIQPIGLVLCNVYFFKIICSNDKFIKSIQFIFHQPFCTLDHRRSNQSTLIIRKWFDMF